MNKQSNNDMLSKALMRGRPYWTSKEEIKAILVQHLETGCSMSIGRAVRREPKKVLSEMVDFMKKLAVHYPEEAGRFLQVPINTETVTPIDQPFFIGEVVEGIVALHSDLLVEEVAHALHSGILTYKYHTAPRINDLIQMMEGYRKFRLEWIEQYYENRKADLAKVPVADTVLEVIKKAQREGAEELRLAEEAKKKAEAKKLKERGIKLEEQMKVLTAEEAARIHETVATKKAKRQEG